MQHWITFIKVSAIISLFKLPLVELAAAIKNECISKICELHRLLFDLPGNQSNRSKIQEFAGLFLPNSDELKNKIKNMKKNFKLSKMITAANILCISNQGTLD